MGSYLITGIAGQDGSYLAEHLLTHGRSVLGTVRPGQSVADLPPSIQGRVALREWDLADPEGMAGILAEVRPAAIFHFAALSSGAGMFDQPALVGDRNGVAVARMLDAVARVSPGTRFCLAASSEMFGHAEASPQRESSPFRPRSPYGAAKLFAHVAVANARERQGLFACSAILFNHESPRRGLEFVTRKISDSAARIKLGLANELPLGNLSAVRDWGYAPDYVRAMALMLEQPAPADFVLATGVGRTVREFCALAFDHVGLDYRDFVREQPENFRPAERVPLIGDAGRARADLCWAPEVAFDELVRRMVDADLARLQCNP
ncbi:GDP-mannose 4,6-dehydratase [Arenimonas alkanexedens]